MEYTYTPEVKTNMLSNIINAILCAEISGYTKSEVRALIELRNNHYSTLELPPADVVTDRDPIVDIYLDQLPEFYRKVESPLTENRILFSLRYSLTNLDIDILKNKMAKEWMENSDKVYAIACHNMWYSLLLPMIRGWEMSITDNIIEAYDPVTEQRYKVSLNPEKNESEPVEFVFDTLQEFANEYIELLKDKYKVEDIQGVEKITPDGGTEDLYVDGPETKETVTEEFAESVEDSEVTNETE